jgi:hypothetical protein
VVRVFKTRVSPRLYNYICLKTFSIVFSRRVPTGSGGAQPPGSWGTPISPIATPTDRATPGLHVSRLMLSSAPLRLRSSYARVIQCFSFHLRLRVAASRELCSLVCVDGSLSMEGQDCVITVDSASVEYYGYSNGKSQSLDLLPSPCCPIHPKTNLQPTAKSIPTGACPASQEATPPLTPGRLFSVMASSRCCLGDSSSYRS